MSTNANVFRSLLRPKWLRDAFRRGTGARLRPDRVLQLVARRRQIAREAVEQARRAWAPTTGTFSFGDTPAERRRRREVRATHTARGRFYVACLCGTVIGFLLFRLLLG